MTIVIFFTVGQRGRSMKWCGQGQEPTSRVEDIKVLYSSWLRLHRHFGGSRVGFGSTVSISIVLFGLVNLIPNSVTVSNVSALSWTIYLVYSWNGTCVLRLTSIFLIRINFWVCLTKEKDGTFKCKASLWILGFNLFRLLMKRTWLFIQSFV